jgi:replicative DNA helicase
MKYNFSQKIKMCDEQVEKLANKYLEKAKNNTWVCPICKNGTGGGDGLRLDPKTNKLTCFSEKGSCINQRSKSIVDYVDAVLGYSNVYKTTDYILQNDLGIQLDKEKAKEEITEADKINQAKLDRFVVNANNSDLLKNYFNSRCISSATIIKNGLVGIDEQNKICFVLNRKKGYYKSRSMNPEDREFRYVPNGIKGEDESFYFNFSNAIKNDIIFIVEGETDALSVMECGYSNVISIPGVGFYKHFAKILIDKYGNSNKKLIVIADNDEATQGTTQGATALEEFKTIITSKDNTLRSIYITPAHNDINDCLVLSKEETDDWLKTLIDNFDFIENEQKTQNLSKYSLEKNRDLLREKMLNQVDGLHLKSKELQEFDKNLGGIKPGVSLIPGKPGDGKTTFALQVCHDLAEQGTKVLFISLEMMAEELHPRNLARNTLQNALNGEKHPISGATDYPRWMGHQFTRYASQKDEPFDEILYKKLEDNYFNKLHNNFYLVDDIDLDFAKIIKIIKDFCGIFKDEKKIVFIDYLQFIRLDVETMKIYQTRREQVDYMLYILRQESKRYNIPLFLLSSVSREHYNSPPSLDWGKESGGIEFFGQHVIVITKGTLFEDGKRTFYWNYKKSNDWNKKKADYQKTNPKSYNVTHDKIETELSQWHIVKNRSYRNNTTGFMEHFGGYYLFNELTDNSKIDSWIIESQADYLERQKKNKLNGGARNNNKPEEPKPNGEANKVDTTNLSQEQLLNFMETVTNKGKK